MKILLVIIACFVTVSAPVIGTEKSYAQGNNAFGFALYGQLARNSKGNLFFSPYSISSALAMTYNGAKGDTAKQMAEVLHFSTDTARLNEEIREVNKALVSRGFGFDVFNTLQGQKDYELDVANALWGQKDYVFLEPFIENMNTYYGAVLNKVDFIHDIEGARNTINHWVKDKTKDKIPEIIQPGTLDISTRLILTDAIYFKGLWLLPFKKEYTRESNFYVNDATVTKTKLIFQGGEKFSYCELEGIQALSLSYKGDMAILIALPDKKQGIAEMEKKLAGGLFTRLCSKLTQQRVEVYLPKFKSSSEFELAGMLSDMGMPDAFVDGPADFSAMAGNKDFYISEVIHKAVVDVYEEGTEAAAATAVVVSRSAGVFKRPAVFRADHPFIYFIYDTRTNLIIFMGRMMNPQEKKKENLLHGKQN